MVSERVALDAGAGPVRACADGLSGARYAKASPQRHRDTEMARNPPGLVAVVRGVARPRQKGNNNTD